MPAVFEELEHAGYTTLGNVNESDFIIGKSLIFRTEDNRSRVFWFVVQDQQNNALGTILFDFFHSHIQFDVPSAPQISVIADTTRERILAGIKRIKEDA